MMLYLTAPFLPIFDRVSIIIRIYEGTCRIGLNQDPRPVRPPIVTCRFRKPRHRDKTLLHGKNTIKKEAFTPGGLQSRSIDKKNPIAAGINTDVHHHTDFEYLVTISGVNPKYENPSYGDEIRWEKYLKHVTEASGHRNR